MPWIVVVLLSQNMSEHNGKSDYYASAYCRLPKFTDAGHHVIDTEFFLNSIPISKKQRHCLSTCTTIKYQCWFNINFDVCYSTFHIYVSFQVMFVGYYGGNGHQPRYLGSAAILLAVGTFIMSLAYFTSPIYTPRDDGFSLLCLPSSSKSWPSMETIAIDGDTVHRPLFPLVVSIKKHDFWFAKVPKSASKSEMMIV